MPETIITQPTAKPAPLQLDCWICEQCGRPMLPIMEYVGGRGYLPHLQCGNPACMFSCSEAYMVRRYGLCGKA